MNKLTKLIIPAAAGALLLTGCSAANSSGNSETTASAVETSSTGSTGSVSDAGSDKLKIVTTIFPEYDWVMNILGDKKADAEVTLLCSSGTDMHSYQPSVDDIMKISDCDIFIYAGGESDKWVEGALKNAANKDMVTVNLIEEPGSLAKEEETVQGMQEEEHDHEGEAHEEGEALSGKADYDEHVWLSLKNAEFLTDSIAEAIESVDAKNAETYRGNAGKYKEALSELDARYQKTVDSATVKTLLFADRFPFRYMTDDYGITYYAAFPGCAAETEASFEMIAFLAGKADELSLKHIMTIEGSDKKIAETIISNTGSKNQDILELNSMQSVTATEIEGGINYLSLMEDNLLVLEKALN